MKYISDVNVRRFDGLTILQSGPEARGAYGILCAALYQFVIRGFGFDNLDICCLTGFGYIKLREDIVIVVILLCVIQLIYNRHLQRGQGSRMFE